MTLNTGAGGMEDLDEEFIKANGKEKHKSKSKRDRAALLAVVRALLKKTTANGCTEAEALSAAAKAKELMDENDITDEELNASEKADNDGGQQQQQQHHARKQADVLIDIALRADLFHAPDGTCYADITVKNHRETWPVRSKGFRRLTGQYYQQEKSAPNSEALQSALNLIEARAHFEAPERAIHVRVASHGGKIYLDLGDATWQAV